MGTVESDLCRFENRQLRAEREAAKCARLASLVEFSDFKELASNLIAAHRANPDDDTIAHILQYAMVTENRCGDYDMGEPNVRQGVAVVDELNHELFPIIQSRISG